LRGAFGGLVMKTTVPAAVAIGEAHARYQSVLDYSPRSAGAKAFESLTRVNTAHGAIIGSGDGDDGTAKANRGRRRRAG
jgi:hypothetical protein